MVAPEQDTPPGDGVPPGGVAPRGGEVPPGGVAPSVDAVPPGGVEPSRGGGAQPPQPPPAAGAVKVEPPRYGRYMVLFVLLILIAITINTLVTRPNGDKGVPVGKRVPPFAVPLALGGLEGDANVATGPGQGEAGLVPACSVRRPEAINVCDLYTGAPLVLALFLDTGSCADVLKDLQALAPSFPGVHIAAVAIRAGHSSVRRLVRKLGLTFPVGFDRQGTLAALYSMASCPQISFIAPGGVVASPALLTRPPRSELRARIAALAAAYGAGGAAPKATAAE